MEIRLHRAHGDVHAAARRGWGMPLGAGRKLARRRERRNPSDADSYLRRAVHRRAVRRDARPSRAGGNDRHPPARRAAPFRADGEERADHADSLGPVVRFEVVQARVESGVHARPASQSGVSYSDEDFTLPFDSPTIPLTRPSSPPPAYERGSSPPAYERASSRPAYERTSSAPAYERASSPPAYERASSLSAAYESGVVPTASSRRSSIPPSPSYPAYPTSTRSSRPPPSEPEQDWDTRPQRRPSVIPALSQTPRPSFPTRPSIVKITGYPLSDTEVTPSVASVTVNESDLATRPFYRAGR